MPTGRVSVAARETRGRRTGGFELRAKASKPSRLFHRTKAVYSVFNRKFRNSTFIYGPTCTCTLIRPSAAAAAAAVRGGGGDDAHDLAVEDVG
jgi:hypothetical protein